MRGSHYHRDLLSTAVLIAQRDVDAPDILPPHFASGICHPHGPILPYQAWNDEIQGTALSLFINLGSAGLLPFFLLDRVATELLEELFKGAIHHH